MALVELELDVVRERGRDQERTVNTLGEDLKRAHRECHRMNSEAAESRQSFLKMETERDEFKHHFEQARASLKALRMLLIKTESAE